MMVKAWDVRGLTPSERLVLLALAECADREGRNAFRSKSTIADYVQLGERTVQLALRNLKARQLIAVQEGPRQRRATTYLLFPRGADFAPLKTGSGEQLGEQKTLTRGASCSPGTLDPLLDPVDPRRLSRRHPEQTFRNGRRAETQRAARRTQVQARARALLASWSTGCRHEPACDDDMQCLWRAMKALENGDDTGGAGQPSKETGR